LAHILERAKSRVKEGLGKRYKCDHVVGREEAIMMMEGSGVAVGGQSCSYVREA